MELGRLPFRKATFQDYVGERGRQRLGEKKWNEAVIETIERIAVALEPDSVVLGGGNAKKLVDRPQMCNWEPTTTPSSERSVSGIPITPPARGRNVASDDARLITPRIEGVRP